ncbi:hypothetical protein [Glaciimonas immobilis]|uniref:Uncharacterized protein n=1 Tax=Glaciimonas immobilis TaxID=728004 RepID=A0A840RP15_9BURK|nr:hypothetical protein [Glaciimonas immobilis]KAF3998968.1 hypothetical protein HAV38_03155 [Glaciimonas immobilis]MBB5198381.1 hypothetical protein [Glaciimonas immobilis]
MAAWLPVAKAILPYLGDIINAAKPAFTRLKGGNEANQIEILQQQVTELQNVSLQNIQNAKALAEQLQVTISALEQTLVAAHDKARRASWIAIIAMAMALVALVMSALAVLR